ncbi:MAG: toxin-antitoxin system toxin subunit [bacterium]|nr:toxin-antitoxin system toxin subunit [bacterium]
MNLLPEILSSKIRAKIFRLLFGIAGGTMHMREIERQTGHAIGTIQTELTKLLRLDLVSKRNDGNRLYYQANKNHPLYNDIRSLMIKTVGLVNIICSAIGHCSDIRVAFVFGSVARHNVKSKSNIDLMMIAKTGMRKATGMWGGMSDQIGREINLHVLSEGEFNKRRNNREAIYSSDI